MRHQRPWFWKSPDALEGTADGTGPGLLYEPGNWGDLLKAAWTARIIDTICRESSSRPVSIIDPFAGRPDYALVESTRTRLARIDDDVLLDAVRADLEAGRWPSTARLALGRVQSNGERAALAVFDLEPEFRTAWNDVAVARVIEAKTGLDLLASDDARDADFVLVDPYDLFDHWKQVISLVVPLSTTTPVLCYLFNKSPRSEATAQYYGALRRALLAGLEATAGTATGLLGSVPSDTIRPRSRHEVILLGHAALVESLRESLREATKSVGKAIGSPGHIESLGHA